MAAAEVGEQCLAYPCTLEVGSVGSADELDVLDMWGDVDAQMLLLEQMAKRKLHRHSWTGEGC